MDDLLFAEGDTLYLCEGQEYEFNFRSRDVIHSAFFPHFRAQMNTVPGMTTRFKFTPSVTTDEMRERMHDSKFNYILMCNKICGGAHYKMKLMVVVLSKAAYKQWYEKVSYDGTDSAKLAASKLFKHTYALGETKLKEKAAQAAAPAADSLAVPTKDSVVAM
jgi:cytochrome c oxidase subunit 2